MRLERIFVLALYQASENERKTMPNLCKGKENYLPPNGLSKSGRRDAETGVFFIDRPF